MSAFKVFKEILELAFGVGIIVASLAMGVFTPLIGLFGGGLILWASYEISKEWRDSGADSDVADMAAERERIASGDHRDAA